MDKKIQMMLITTAYVIFAIFAIYANYPSKNKDCKKKVQSEQCSLCTL